MAKEFDNTNRGALFKNDEKGDNEKAPDYTGPADVDGKPKRIAAWLREIKKGENAGKKFLSLQIEDADTKGGGKSKVEEDDDVPF